MKRWQLVMPGTAEKLDPIAGLLDLAQGDTPIWFDGAGTIEVVEPILIWVGDNTTTAITLPHRHVFVASTVVYVNGGATNAWAPLGGDGVTMDKIAMFTPPGQFSQIKVKYRRKCKVVISMDEDNSRERLLRDQSNNASSIYAQTVYLQEIAN